MNTPTSYNISTSPCYNFTDPNYPMNTTGYCIVENDLNNLTKIEPQIYFTPNHSEEIAELINKVDRLEKLILNLYEALSNEEN